MNKVYIVFRESYESDWTYSKEVENVWIDRDEAEKFVAMMNAKEMKCCADERVEFSVFSVGVYEVNQ